MSGTRLTRKVTVEGGKKLPEGGGSNSSSSAGIRRLSVFERLGPGTSDRSKPREPRESYPPEKCRNWLRDGRCSFGRNCKFLHGPFSEPKQRKKGARSVVRGELDRSEERDEGHLGGRTRSLDSLDVEGDEERPLPLKKKKHKTLEESSDPAKRSEKVKRKQIVEKESSDNEEEAAEDERKRKKKAKKRQLSGGVVVAKPRSPEQEARDWGYDEFEEERRDLDWEEQGELDYERQMMLEKRRQDLRRQLALMDEEEAAIEKAERKVRDVKKEREDEPRAVPVVHSKLHPDKASVSPGDEPSPVSSQSTPKKKKKKSNGEAKKLKLKRKSSPSSKESKKRKRGYLPPEEFGEDTEAGNENLRRASDLTSEKLKVKGPQVQLNVEMEALVKPRVAKKKEMKAKAKESRSAKASENIIPSPPSEERVRVVPRTPPEQTLLREKWSYSPETERLPAERVRRRAVLSSPEGHDSPTVQPVSEDRARRVTTPFEDSSQKIPRDVRDVANVQHSNKGKIHDKRYGIEGSPGTPLAQVPRYFEEGKVEKRRKPPRSPSPEDISPRDAATSPEEHRRQRTPPQGDRRGPQTPPGEPDFDEEPVEHTADSRRDVRRRKGPYTPPPPPGEQIRPKVESSRDFRESRSEPVRYREPPDGPRIKERDERETRYQKPRSEDKLGDFPRGDREHPQLEDEYARNRTRDRDEEYHRGRPKDDRGDDSYRTRDREPERGSDHHRSRAEEFRGDEHQRRKADGSDEFFRRRDERDDDHLRGRNREPEKVDERQRRREDRPDEYQRNRGREEHEDDLQRSRVRDYPSRRQMEVSDDRYWDRRGERESREPPYGDRDRRRQDLPRQDIPDSRGRERPGDRPRERDLRHPPPGPDYHRRLSPIPQGPRRSPPHGPPRGRSPHRYDERRRSLSPGGRRDDGYRQGPPRDQGGFGVGRDPMRGRGAYSTPFDNRGRPLENRRRMSPPPKQYAERGRAGLRGRGGGGGGRGGRGFPDRMRPPGDRYREQPRDSGAPWDRDRRVPERDHPRDRGRPHEESRDRDRRARGDISPGRGPRHWEDRKGGSPTRAGGATRDKRAQDTDRVPREDDEEHRRRTEEEEEDEEWEYEEDMGEEKLQRHTERKRPRENAPSISRSASPVGGKKRRSESPEMKDVPTNVVAERTKEVNNEAEPGNTVIMTKPTTKVKKRKEGKKEGTSIKPEGETVSEMKLPQEAAAELGVQPEGEKRTKAEKKHKKDKGKMKEKGAKKKKKSSATLGDPPEAATEVVEAVTKKLEDGGAPASEITGEVIQRADVEQIPKVAKKRKHAAAVDDEGAKVKLGDKPSKKKKKKKHQPEVVVQPWADLEGDEEETTATEHETSEARASEKEDTDAAQTREESLQEEKLSEAVEEESGKNPESSESKEPPAAKRMEEVFSDWSDDSPIGDDTWSDINEPTISDEQPKVDEKERKHSPSPGTNAPPSFDDVYDPISDDELDAMLGEEDDNSGGRPGDGNAGDSATTPMPVEDVDWSALVSAQSTMEKKEEPGSHLKKFAPGHVFSHIGISSLLAGPRLTKLVQESLVLKEPSSANSIGALMAGAAAKRRERETLFANVGPCRRALCARRDLAMRKRLRRLTGKVGLFQTPSSAPVDNELYLMSVALYKHDPSATDSSSTKFIPSRVGSVLTTVTS